jgi:hypothetical protein
MGLLCQDRLADISSSALTGLHVSSLERIAGLIHNLPKGSRAAPSRSVQGGAEKQSQSGFHVPTLPCFCPRRKQPIASGQVWWYSEIDVD